MPGNKAKIHFADDRKCRAHASDRFCTRALIKNQHGDMGIGAGTDNKVNGGPFDTLSSGDDTTAEITDPVL